MFPLITGFHKLTIEERRKIVAKKIGINPKEIEQALDHGTIGIDKLDKMIENVIGVWQLPYSVVPNFLINGKEYLVPMVGYEPSVVAAAGKTAKIIRKFGGFNASADEPIMIAQIPLYEITDSRAIKDSILENRNCIIKRGNQALPNLIKRGGGITGLEIVDYPGTGYLVIELYINVLNAMGANIVDEIAEYVSPLIYEITGQKILMRILTNYAASRKVRSGFSVPLHGLDTKKISGEELAKRIVCANEFAGLCPKRACTQNKGGFNGMDAVSMATGNDCQALEAGGHCHASSSGYETLCKFFVSNGHLRGEIELPAAVGIVGGISQIHAGVQFSLKMLRVKSAQELAMVIASVGLANTFAAVSTLVTEGIQRSHMALHFRKKLNR